jgi:hypothetical protein
LSILVLTGCGRSATDGSDLEKSFQSGKGGPAGNAPGAMQSADPATKAMVNDAITAIKNNDPAEGVVILQGVRAQPNLTPEQLTSVQDMIANAQKSLVDRADRGDPAALAAMQRIREGKRRR